MKYLLASLILHSLLLIPGMQASIPDVPVEVTFETTEPETKMPPKQNIVEKSTETADEEGTFYWGVGIDVNLIDSVLITGVTPGYCGEAAGLKVGDIILSVNGSATGEIKGDEPKTLLLTILRNGVKINISVERCKVYYN